MKTINPIIISGIAAATQIAHAGTEAKLPLKDLYQMGLNPEAVREVYRNKANVELDWNEVLKVSADEEGKKISFNTIDNITVVVPINFAFGPENKTDVPSPM